MKKIELNSIKFELKLIKKKIFYFYINLIKECYISLKKLN